MDLSAQGTRFSPLTSSLRRDHVALNSALDDETYVKQVWTEGSDDTFMVHIAYVLHGQEQKAEFGAADYDPQNEFEKEIEGGGQWLWSITGSFCCDSAYQLSRRLTTSVIGSRASPTRIYTTAGVRTDPANMPAGSATYAGGIRADAYRQDSPSNDFRNSVRGDLNLTADFDASTLEGNVSGIQTRPQGASWSPLSDTTSFEIGNGQIAGGQFTATLSGADTNSAAALDASMRGYEGNVLGEFYGPAAEEVGGVFTATRDEDQRRVGRSAPRPEAVSRLNRLFRVARTALAFTILIAAGAGCRPPSRDGPPAGRTHRHAGRPGCSSGRASWSTRGHSWSRLGPPMRRNPSSGSSCSVGSICSSECRRAPPNASKPSFHSTRS